MAGRKSKFTEETRQLMYEAMKDGLIYKQIASYSGISETLLYRWINNAKEIRDRVDNEEIDYDDLSNDEKEWYDWIVTWYKVEAEYLRDRIKDIQKSDPKWILARRFREDYNDDYNVNVKGQMQIQHEHSWRDMVEQASKEDDE